MAAKDGTRRGRAPSHGHALRGKQSATWKKWCSMHRRCRGYSQKDFRDYVQKGISVCSRWNRFEQFLEDMGECPDGLTLDRIDSAAGYYPENCRWATKQTQAVNRSISKHITFNGQTHHLSEWARRTGISQPTLSLRLKAGWSIERALATSPEVYKQR